MHHQTKFHRLVHNLQIQRSQRPPGDYTEPPAITWAKISKQRETPCWLFSLPVMKIVSASSSSTAVNTSLGPHSHRRESFIFRDVLFVCFKLQLFFGRSISKPPRKFTQLFKSYRHSCTYWFLFEFSKNKQSSFLIWRFWQWDCSTSWHFRNPELNLNLLLTVWMQPNQTWPVFVVANNIFELSCGLYL